MEFRVEEFPDDERVRVVRWFDHIRANHDATGSPGVEVLLHALAPGADAACLPRFDRNLPLDPAGEVTPRPVVHAGLIPALTIGGVFTGRSFSGWLPAEHEQKRFRFTQLRATVLRPGDGNPAPRPTGWREDLAWTVLGHSAYPLGAFTRSWCLVLDGVHQGRDAQLVLPCPEVFRGVYGTTRSVALGLTSALWSEAMEKLTNVRRCIVEDGVWKVGLRKDIPDALAPLLGMLMLTPEGFDAASRLLEGKFGDRDAPARLRAALPFAADELDVTVRCLSLRPEGLRWFGFELLRLDWPLGHFGPSGKVLIARDNSADEGDEVTTTDGPSPFAPKDKMLVDDGTDEAPVTGSEDPAPARPVEIGGRVPVFGNVPELEHVRKPKSRRYEPPRKPGGVEAVGKASAGSVGSGGSASIPANLEGAGAPAASPRFAKLAAVLERLEASGGLSREPPVAVPPPSRVLRGGDAVWKLPPPANRARRGWTVLPGTRQVRRTAMVATVRIGGRTVHLIELEEDPGGSGSSMLLCRLSPGHEPAGIEKLLKAVARTDVSDGRTIKAGGVWPKPGGLADGVLILSAKTWRHRFGADGDLDGSALLRGLNAVG